MAIPSFSMKGNRYKGRPSTASVVRDRIQNGGERYWKVTDFPDLPSHSVSKTLSRMVEANEITRPKRGVYYRPRQTSFGMSAASPSAMAALPGKHVIQPAGLSAANVLGLTTQIPARPSIATTAPALTEVAKRTAGTVKTRRPEARRKLTAREGALLEVLRDRAATSDLDFSKTRAKLLKEVSNGKTFSRLAGASHSEPPRVRAMLGALGQEAQVDPKILQRLKKDLNPLSTYDFGVLKQLDSAADWQAR